MSTTIRELSTKRYIRIQPVENRIISHCILILKILYEGSTSKNQMFNKLKKDESKVPYKTDKSSTLEAIKHLRKSELVSESRCPSTNKEKKKRRVKTQRTVVELTQLGKELSQLIYYLNEYGLSNRKLKNKINFHFADFMVNLKPAILQRRLKQKGWESQEIEDSTLIEGVLILQSHLPLVLFNTILSRYFKIIYKYTSLNDLAKEILRKIIMDSMMIYSLDRLEGILADQISSNNHLRDNAFRITYRLLSSWIQTYVEHYADIYSKNRHIQEESLELLMNLYHILNPEENYLQNVLGRRAKTNPRLAAIIKNLDSSNIPPKQ